MKVRDLVSTHQVVLASVVSGHDAVALETVRAGETKSSTLARLGLVELESSAAAQEV